jgi:hypothetical protein
VAYITDKIRVVLSLLSISRLSGYNSILEIKRKRFLKTHDADVVTVLSVQCRTVPLSYL